MAKIVLEGVSKIFKGKAKPAVHDVDLEVEDGEFLVMVGPSGCGKTTTLRMIAGFETPTEGVIRIGGKAMNSVLPKDRNLAMVFQNYALFPHMTVAKNLSFGMKARHEPKATINREIETIASMLGIDPLLDRKPAELSGGERQRVALGRALLRRPQAFLMDEPLSNLDAALRVQMRLEIKRIHAQFPVTTVYVTHDQVEAMTMADRIALMNAGRLQQTAGPESIYGRPANSFVASFIGTPKINFFSGTVVRDGGTLRVKFLDCSCEVNGAAGKALADGSRSTVTVG
ncbi:MAG: ABC transporter ATP-binding protein, partial [Acidimicrobiales bacterium]